MAGAHGDNGCPTCHVPHQALPNNNPNAYGPLWAPTVAAKELAVFTLYSSPTFDALNTGITQPDGASKMCLGCHDGSYAGVALEHTFGEGRPMSLSNSHPISFRYDTALTLNSKLRVAGSLRDPVTAPSGLTPRRHHRHRSAGREQQDAVQQLSRRPPLRHRHAPPALRVPG